MLTSLFQQGPPAAPWNAPAGMTQFVFFTSALEKLPLTS